jgi:hypothetical protein
LIFYQETPALLSLPLEWAKHPETSPMAFALSEPGPGLVHSLDVRGGTGAGVAMEDADASGATPTVNTGSTTTGITAAATSTGGGSSQNVQPTIIVNKLIRVL